MPNQTQANGLPRDGEEFREWDEDVPVPPVRNPFTYDPEVMNSLTGASLTNMWSDGLFDTGTSTFRFTEPPRAGSVARVRPGAPTRSPLDDLSVRQAQARAARAVPEPPWVTARRNAEQARRDEQRRIVERLEAEALQQRTAAMAAEIDRETINTIMGSPTIGATTTSSRPDQVRYAPGPMVNIEATRMVQLPQDQLREWHGRLMNAYYSHSRSDTDRELSRVFEEMQGYIR